MKGTVSGVHPSGRFGEMELSGNKIKPEWMAAYHKKQLPANSLSLPNSLICLYGGIGCKGSFVCYPGFEYLRGIGNITMVWNKERLGCIP